MRPKVIYFKDRLEAWSPARIFLSSRIVIDANGLTTDDNGEKLLVV